MELLADADGDGDDAPFKGERLAVLELGGKLIPNGDRSELSLNVNDRKLDNILPE